MAAHKEDSWRLCGQIPWYAKLLTTAGESINQGRNRRPFGLPLTRAKAPAKCPHAERDEEGSWFASEIEGTLF
ncbi:MAG: hypothetical protein EB072_17920 [Betaproteobacteria bacterium]|nr:hypothetical protein [Betaproteobacteria bacterium]